MPPPLSIDTHAPLSIRTRSDSVSSQEEEEDMSELSAHELRKVKEDVAHLVAGDVRLVAIDADLTLFCVHTGGKWRGSAEELSLRIRPLFKALIRECVTVGLHVAIVTFSPQAQLIRDALLVAIPDVDLSDLLVRGGQRKVVCENGDLADTSHWDGARKQKHIGSVIDTLSARGANVRPDEIVLVDDDLFNVEEARDHGMRGALFNLESTQKLPTARRRSSLSTPESTPRGGDEGAKSPPRLSMMRSRSMPPEESAFGSSCLSAD